MSSPMPEIDYSAEEMEKVRLALRARMTVNAFHHRDRIHVRQIPATRIASLPPPGRCSSTTRETLVAGSRCPWTCSC
jgi:hypothetical protein